MSSNKNTWVSSRALKTTETLMRFFCQEMDVVCDSSPQLNLEPSMKNKLPTSRWCSTLRAGCFLRVFSSRKFHGDALPWSKQTFFHWGKTTVTHTSIHVLRVFPSPTSYPIGSMYGLFIYIRWKMATFKGKCRFLVGIHIPYMDSLGMVIPRNPRLLPCFFVGKKSEAEAQ